MFGFEFFGVVEKKLFYFVFGLEGFFLLGSGVEVDDDLRGFCEKAC